MKQTHNIKQLRPNLSSRYKQGYVRPDSCKKYVGSGPIIYRSSYERKFIIWLETCKNIVHWSSETIEIPYMYVDGKVHRYYPDYFVETVDGRKFIVEVKPSNQTSPPVKETPYSIREWTKNKCKWEAAKDFCAARGLEFQIITEKTIDKL